MPTDSDRLLAALAHASSVVGFAIVGPLVLWAISQSPERSFVAYHAKQAAVFHTAAFMFVMVTAFCTFGLSTILLLPWFALDLWLGWRAYQGEWAGYPGLGDWGRP